MGWQEWVIGGLVFGLSGVTLAWCWVVILEVLETQRWLRK
jgi:hypothetical protein